MSAPLAVVLEGTVEADCTPEEVNELHENSGEIGDALRALGHRVEVLSLSLDIEDVRRKLVQLAPDIVFNLVDSIEGKGNLVSMAPMLLSHLKIPYTGANSLATCVTCDKLLTKQLLCAQNIPTAPWLTEAEIEAGGEELAAPYILKSITEHASFGLFADSVVASRAELKSRWQERKAQYGNGSDWFAESYIEGREFNLALLATDTPPYLRAMPPAEIRFTSDFPEGKPRFIDYAAKWYVNTPEYIGTQRSFEFSTEDAPVLERIKDIALSCWQAFGLAGYARVDYRVDATGTPYVLEVNCNPFLTAQEGLCAAAKRAGMDFTDVIRAIVADAYRRSHVPLPEALAA